MFHLRSSARHVLLVFAFLAVAPGAAIGANLHGLFASVEFRTAPLERSQGWDSVRHALRSQRFEFSRCAAHYAACSSRQMRRWNRLAAATAGLPPGQKLAMVNSFFNGWRYRDDAGNYGVAEHWASPAEFMSHSGDCEDYALVKFFALRLLGFRDDQMRIVIVRDDRRSANHAVLAVTQGKETLILDNLSDRIAPHRSFPHYIARVSFNEGGYWAHLPVRHLAAAAPSAANKPL